MGQINFLTILKDWLSRCNQNKRKSVAPHINLFSSVTTYYFLTTDSKLAITTAGAFLSSLAFLSSYLHFTLTHFVAIQKPCQGNFEKSEESGESSFNFGKFQNGSINLFGITSEEIWFIIS